MAQRRLPAALWSAQSVSQLGSQVTGLALPLAAIFVVHASTFEVAALNVVDFLPFALFSLPAGVWVDRLRRRPLMIAADWGRAAALAARSRSPTRSEASPSAQLFVVGFVAGTLTVFFDVSYQSYPPDARRPRAARRRELEARGRARPARSSRAPASPACSSARSRRRTRSRPMRRASSPRRSCSARSGASRSCRRRSPACSGGCERRSRRGSATSSGTRSCADDALGGREQLLRDDVIVDPPRVRSARRSTCMPRRSG